MRGHQLANPSLLLALLGLPALGLLETGCVRYYAGAGYAASYGGSVTTSASSAGAASLEGSSTELAAAGGGGVEVLAAAEVDPALGAASGAGSDGDAYGESPWVLDGVTEVSSGLSASGSLDFLVPSSSVSGSLAAGSSSTTLDVAGALSATLSGLVGAGAPSPRGGVARLDGLFALDAASLSGGVQLYADANVRVSASLAHDALPASGGASQVVVTVEGLAPPAVVPPLRVHLVIDASTSMADAWPDVRASALAVLRHLRPQDELQIVVYGTTATEALAPITVGDGARARQVIGALRYGGQTNIEAGLRLAYGALRPAGRSLVVVISDGVPQGGLSGPSELGALSARANQVSGAVTLTVGLGTEFHTGVLSELSRAGGGELLLAPRSNQLTPVLERAIASRGAVVVSGLEGSVSASAGVRLDASGALLLGALAAGEVQRFVVPITTTHGGTVARVRLRFLDAQGLSHELEASLSLAEGAAPVPAGAIAAVLDQSLSLALRAAGARIEQGDGAGAAAALQAHIDEARAIDAARPSATLEARTEQVVDLALALPGLVANASWGERRAAGASFVARSFAIGG